MLGERATKMARDACCRPPNRGVLGDGQEGIGLLKRKAFYLFFSEFERGKPHDTCRNLKLASNSRPFTVMLTTFMERFLV